MNKLPKQKNHSWPSRNPHISDAKNKHKTKQKKYNLPQTTVLTISVSALIPMKILTFFFFFLNQCTSVSTMEGKCNQKTRERSHSAQEESAKQLAWVGTHVPGTILPPRPFNEATISLHLQSVQHTFKGRSSTHTGIELEQRWGKIKVGSLVPGTSGRGKAKGCPMPTPLMSSLNPEAPTVERQTSLSSMTQQVWGRNPDPGTWRDKHRITGCGH